MEQTTQIADRQRTEAFNPELRRYHDLTTWLAEALDGQMRTPFRYRFDGQELYGADNSAMGRIFETSIIAAERMAASDPRLQFELRRRRLEYQEYQSMLAMAAGTQPNTMIVVSDFPAEAHSLGADTKGYNCERQQTMLRVITRDADGALSMYSQSLDRSDRAGLEALYELLGAQAQPGELLGQRLQLELGAEAQALLIDQLTLRYDQVLSARYGGNWHAGRRSANRLNTYDFVVAQQDLLQAVLGKGEYRQEQLYELAAAMQARYEFGQKVGAVSFLPATGYVADPYAEMRQAGSAARAEGKRFNGCGASVGASGDSTESELDAAGYGNPSDEESAPAPSTLRCVNCKENVASKEVIKPKSWCCPKCRYEVDICTGKILNTGNTVKRGKIGQWTTKTLFTKNS